MPLVSASLGAGLANMSNTDSEATVIDNFVNAWDTYFSTAQALTPAIPGSYAGALSAMRAALSGITTADNAATAIQTGITAFWGVVAGSAATIWPPALSATPPPGLSGISSALQGVFSANTSGDLPIAAAAMAVAGAIHGTQSGAIAIYPPPPANVGPMPIN